MAVKKVIGVNSGSSFDGIDAALFETRLGGDGQPVRPSFLDGITVDWPKSIVSLVMDAFEDRLGIFRLCRLNYEVGAVYAGVVRQLLDKNGLSPEDVSVVGLDGQTIYQEPPDKEAVISGRMDGSDKDWLGRWRNGPYACGLQIGDSSVIAGLTGVTTVTHFRAADHVFGGTGAPLMQYLDYVAFRDIGPVLTLNIGGIANCQLADRDRDAMIAFDTGPGNVMMDCAAQELFNLRYDPEGTIAATGRASREMLDELKRHRFFTRRPPRSAWRLDFGSDYASNILARYAHLPPADILATLTRFTATAIGLSIKEFMAHSGTHRQRRRRPQCHPDAHDSGRTSGRDATRHLRRLRPSGSLQGGDKIRRSGVRRRQPSRQQHTGVQRRLAIHDNGTYRPGAITCNHINRLRKCPEAVLDAA